MFGDRMALGPPVGNTHLLAKAQLLEVETSVCLRAISGISEAL